jgi:hypothetical protein
MVAAVAIVRARRGGIVIARVAWTAAKRSGLPFPFACALLEQESGGGHNEFGHDPTIFAGAGTVTRAKYLAYRAERDRTGRMQGVGPCQLTWSGYQDAADAAGGCWTPPANCLIGFGLLAEHIRRDGLHAGIAAYNGSGPAAERYADDVIALAQRWTRILNPPSPAAPKARKIPC